MINNKIQYWHEPKSGGELIICRDSRISYPWHNHVSVYCFGLLLGGELELTWGAEAGGAVRRLQAGRWFVIPPYLPHKLTTTAPYTLLTLCIPAPAADWAEPELKQIKRQLEQAPELPLSLVEMAAAAYLSKYHFLRCFKRSVGLTPHQFQLQNRVRKAQRLLRQGVCPADAALQSGFFDQSHFSRHFVKQLGLTPAAYQAACFSFAPV